MKENYIKKLYANRLTNNQPEKKDAAINVDISKALDFSLEQPDAMPDIFVIDRLYQEASKWENRGYLNKTKEHFNDSVVTYLNNFYDTCKLDRLEEVSVTQGTTAALNMLCMAFVNPGDGVLITKPSVTTLETLTEWLGGNVIALPLTQKNNYLPKYEEISQKSLKKAKILYLSYPNNPTGGCAAIEFFKETIDFAKTNNLIVVHDASFASLVYEEGRQLSFLSVEGAKKVGVEIHSFSHAFNMAGWRIGFIAGNKNIIKAYCQVAEKSRTVQFVPIQQAAAYALTQTDTAYKTAKKYERRMHMLCRVLDSLGFKFKQPSAGFYLFVKAPKETSTGNVFNTAYQFRDFLAKKNIVVKAFDEGIRFSVTYSAFGEQEEAAVTAELYERLKEDKFIF